MVTQNEITKVNQLIDQIWQLSGLPKGGSIADYNILAWQIIDEIRCDISGKSIKELAEVNMTQPLKGFLKNTTKEVLALYFFYKTGRIREEKFELLSGNKTRKPKPLYWRLYLKIESKPELVRINDYPDGLCPIPEQFTNTKWWCYAASPHGVFKQLLVISADKHRNGFNKVEVLSGVEAYEDFEGFVALDVTQCYLIIDAITKLSKQKNVHAKVRLGRGVKLPNISIGQMSFISSYESKILSRTLILERIADESEIELLPAGHIEYSSKNIETIPDLVKDYLHSKEKNRLASPIQDIANYKDLAVWIDEQRSNKQADEILKSYEGNYYLYRCICDDDEEHYLEENRMRLQYCPAEHKMHVVLMQHDMKALQSSNVNRYDKYISVLWETKINQETRTLFLNFQIGHINFDGFQCFTGIMTGVSRRQDNIASYKVLIVKEDIVFDRVNDERIRSFFMKDNNEIINKTPTGFKLNRI